MIRVSCSKIAHLTGFHPYGDLPLSIIDLVYQDRDAMRRRDGKSWNVTWVNEDEVVRALLTRSGAERVRRHMSRSGKEKSLKDVRQSEAEMMGALRNSSAMFTEQERELLVNKARHDVFTKFGSNHENKALEMYERKTGREVQDSNSKKYFWVFPSDRTKLRAPNLLLNERNDQGWTEDLCSSKRKNNDKEVIAIVLRFAGQECDLRGTIYRKCLLGDGWLQFPNSLKKRQRFLVHQTCETVGLPHDSKGEKSNRYVIIRKNEHVRILSLSLSLSFYLSM